MDATEQRLVIEAKEWINRLLQKPHYRNHQNIQTTLILASEAIVLLEAALIVAEEFDVATDDDTASDSRISRRVAAVSGSIVNARAGTA